MLTFNTLGQSVHQVNQSDRPYDWATPDEVSARTAIKGTNPNPQNGRSFIRNETEVHQIQSWVADGSESQTFHWRYVPEPPPHENLDTYSFHCHVLPHSSPDSRKRAPRVDFMSAQLEGSLPRGWQDQSQMFSGDEEWGNELRERCRTWLCHPEVVPLNLSASLLQVTSSTRCDPDLDGHWFLRCWGCPVFGYQSGQVFPRTGWCLPLGYA